MQFLFFNGDITGVFGNNSIVRRA